MPLARRRALGVRICYMSACTLGEAASFAIADDGRWCVYDLRFVLEDGRDRLDRVDVCARPVYKLEDER
jgi:hypothetical protein